MKRINHQAPVVCSNTITINANIEQVWRTLTDIDRWPTWQTAIKKSKLNGELGPQTSFDWKNGESKIHSTLHTVKPFKNFGWTGKSMGAYAIHNWTLTETEGKTFVFVEESMEGLTVWLFKRMINQSLENGMQKWLQLLKQTCEQSLPHKNTRIPLEGN